jgi:hypothetical protein
MFEDITGVIRNRNFKEGLVLLTIQWSQEQTEKTTNDRQDTTQKTKD